jgi:regulator of RNase E activity RraA
VVELETGGDVEIGDARVANGDFVIADGSGVVFVAADKIASVLSEAEEIAFREAEMAKALLDGIAPSEVMTGNYEHMLERK